MKIIYKYQNRKFYDKSRKQYITLKDIGNYVDNDESIVVYNHKTNAAITDEVLIAVLNSKLINWVPINCYILRTIFYQP